MLSAASFFMLKTRHDKPFVPEGNDTIPVVRDKLSTVVHIRHDGARLVSLRPHSVAVPSDPSLHPYSPEESSPGFRLNLTIKTSMKEFD